MWDNQTSVQPGTHVSLRILQRVWSERRSPHVRAFGGPLWERARHWEVGGSRVVSGRWRSSARDFLSHRDPCWHNQSKHSVSFWGESDKEALVFNNCWCRAEAFSLESLNKISINLSLLRHVAIVATDKIPLLKKWERNFNHLRSVYSFGTSFSAPKAWRGFQIEWENMLSVIQSGTWSGFLNWHHRRKLVFVGCSI